MSFLKKFFGGSSSIDGNQLVVSGVKSDYAQIELLAHFATAQALHSPADRARWNRVLPQPYDETIALFQKLNWLEQAGGSYRVATKALPFVEQYRARQAAEKAEIMPKVRQALQEKDASEALSLRRLYEARQPLGQADWTGPEPQLSHSALTRRILYLQHWLLDGLSKETVEWLKLYAAEEHLWGTSWRLAEQGIPAAVKADLRQEGVSAVDAAYWKAWQLALYVDNQETWQRCKGGDHVRRIEIVGPDDAYTCAVCKAFLGKEFLVIRTPELPPRNCTSSIGCRCRYEPVLESYEISN